ncbi:hypothetical protein KHQ06_35925 [Nocardia tengchongensis]|uniref:Uncharacterized protein n=1 Tax=Nocardia tengchongensis TaxID=2055889 RepID=A0ABX8CT01_9NOCA|nr:hypothetical protein [Nocardia tengchongensis]QVI21310.1 hypothetical protein KHQ06_35925 [Nocardia tengchongensis]
MLFLADARLPIDDVDLDWDEVLEMERTVAAFPTGEIGKGRRRIADVAGGIGPRDHLTSMDDPQRRPLAKTGGQPSRGLYGEGRQHGHCLNRQIVHPN